MKHKVRKKVGTALYRLFHARNIIVVSDHAVEHYPLSGKLQILGLLSIAGFIAWASYSSGSYMAAKNQIAQKDRQLREINLENQKMVSNFSLLRRDLLKIKDKNGDVGEYTKYLIDQYTKDDQFGVKNLTMSNAVTPEEGMVIDRINFLEQRIEKMQHDREKLVKTIRKITEDKIDVLEEAINMTGLDGRILQQKQISAYEDEKDPSRDMNNLAAIDIGPKGGPLIPLKNETAQDIEKEAIADVKYLMILHDVIEDIPLAYPIEHVKATSGFGVRIDPFTHSLARHTGIDLSGPIGSKVHSSADGVVRSVGRKGAYGIAVEIEHGLGISTLYGHLGRALVKPGQHIKKGTVVGIQGSTGRSTGNHLHYEVRYNDDPRNPSSFLKAGQYVSKNID
ncbi:MAG: M23 family metallopeptidase [Rickettsiales bacterium]